MLRVLWNSKSAMMANTEKLDAISTNMANTNTNGYKKVDVSFKDLVSESLDRNGYPLSNNKKGGNTPFTGTGVRASEWTRNNRQGDLNQTNNPTDFAIDGPGYFKVIRPNGEAAYTRVGNFQIDATGKLSDSNGNLLNIKYDKGYSKDNVKFSKDNYNVSENGDITIKVSGISKKIGSIPLFSANGDSSFKSVGDSLYVPEQGAAVYNVKNASIRQGFTENSNVDIASEMTEMIITQRAFELNAKGLKVADDMWGIANNLRSK